MSEKLFTALDVRRAIKSVEAGGKCVAAVDFPKEGGFRLLLGEPVTLELPRRSGENEWDVVLAQ